MAKPVIWTVDDDPDLLRAVERDLAVTPDAFVRSEKIKL